MLLGGHAAFAMDESQMANSAGIIDYLCCVGSDEVFSRDPGVSVGKVQAWSPNIFSIQGSYTK